MTDLLKSAFQTIINEVGENKNREGLIDTPERAAIAMKFLTSGYNTDLAEIVNNAI